MINDVGAPSAGTSSTTDVLSAEGVCLRSTQDVTIGFTLLHAGKQKDQQGQAGHDRSAVVPTQRDTAVPPQTPVQPVN